MSIEVSMTGSGTIGPIQPGWSVNEYATPVTPGETAGGTGQVNIAAAANDDTLFIVNNSITTTEETLGSVSGVVKAVNQTGISASFSHNTQLALFDANLNIPALGAGGVVPAVDVCSQLTGRDIILKSGNEGYYYSLRGHSQGFDSTGAVASSKTWNGKVYDWTPDVGWVYYTGQTGSIYADNFFTLNNDIWAGRITGDYLEDDFTKTSSRIAFKTMLNETTLELNYYSTLYTFDNDNEGAYTLTLYINPVSKTMFIDGEVIIGGSWATISGTTSIAGLDLTKELSVFTEFKRPSSYSGAHTYTAIVCNTSNYNVSYSVGATYNAVRALGSYWNLRQSGDLIIIGAPTNASGVRGLYRAEDAGLPTAGFATVATNYILNPSFASNTNNWNAFGTGGASLSLATGGYVGTNCLRVTQTNVPGYNLPDYGVQQRFNVKFVYPLIVDSVSAYVKGPASGSNLNIYVEQYNASGTLIATTKGSLYNNQQYGYSTGSWVRISTGFSLVAGVEYILVKIVGSNSEYFVDAVMLTLSTISSSLGYVPDYFDGDTADNATFTYSYDANGYSIQQASLSAINQEYENPKNYSYQTLTIGGGVGGVDGNGWQYIQDACSAYGEELSLIENNIVIRPVGTNTVSLDNIVGAPSIAPSMVLGGRNVEIVYSDSSTTSLAFYNARNDSNRVLSVKAKETVTTTVTLNGTPSILWQPIRSTAAPTGNLPNNRYVVSGATGTIIPANQWEDYGGSLKVTISETVPNSADIILTGPIQDIPGNAGPYKIAYTASGTDYAALNIAGFGVTLNNKTLKLQTGADPLKVSNDVAKTITNPFIDTLERAYDRGIWAANNAAGPTVTLTGTIPVSAISSFGIAAGSLVSYRDSAYRITDCTIGNLGVNFTAVRHVTVEEFDAIWAGKSVEFYDMYWEGHDSSDTTIAPLRYSNVIKLALDDDGITPYESFVTGYDNIYLDDDGVPYFAPQDNAVGARLIYLDDDATVYYV